MTRGLYPKSSRRREEFGSAVLDGRHHERAIKELIALLTGRLGHQNTSVARRPEKRGMVVLARLVMSMQYLWIMSCRFWIAVNRSPNRKAAR
jgi:hypothetical protein